jgi:hypothetical protein
VSIDPYEAYILCRALGVQPPPDASATQTPLSEDVEPDKTFTTVTISRPAARAGDPSWFDSILPDGIMGFVDLNPGATVTHGNYEIAEYVDDNGENQELFAAQQRLKHMGIHPGDTISGLTMAGTARVQRVIPTMRRDDFKTRVCRIDFKVHRNAPSTYEWEIDETSSRRRSTSVILDSGLVEWLAWKLRDGSFESKLVLQTTGEDKINGVQFIRSAWEERGETHVMPPGFWTSIDTDPRENAVGELPWEKEVLQDDIKVYVYRHAGQLSPSAAIVIREVNDTFWILELAGGSQKGHGKQAMILLKDLAFKGRNHWRFIALEAMGGASLDGNGAKLVRRYKNRAFQECGDVPTRKDRSKTVWNKTLDTLKSEAGGTKLKDDTVTSLCVWAEKAAPEATIMVCNSECFDGDTGIVSEEEDPVIAEETDTGQEEATQDTAIQVQSDASAMSESDSDFEGSGESEDSESEDSESEDSESEDSESEDSESEDSESEDSESEDSESEDSV